MHGLLRNDYRITFGSFLAYFVMSAFISPLGVVSGPLADHFDISVTTATASFTYLTSGVFAGTLLAVFVFDILPLKQVIVGGVGVITAAVLTMFLVDSFVVFSLALALIGASCGVELSAAAVVITKLFEEKLRASMLLLTDSFYSLAGVVSTSLAGVLLARELHWFSAYLLALIVTLMVGALALTGRYHGTGAAEREQGTATAREWPPGVHLVGLAILVYLVGFVSIYSWVPNYAQSAFGVDIETGSEIVSRFFLGLFIGQLIMFVLVLRLPLRGLILAYAALATLMTVSLWTAASAAWLELAMLVLGLVTGGLFKTVLTYGTTLVRLPGAKMVSYLIFYAGLGTAIAPFMSAIIVERADMAAALKFATACYVVTLMLIAAAQRLETHAAGGDGAHAA